MDAYVPNQKKARDDYQQQNATVLKREPREKIEYPRPCCYWGISCGGGVVFCPWQTCRQVKP